MSDVAKNAAGAGAAASGGVVPAVERRIDEALAAEPEAVDFLDKIRALLPALANVSAPLAGTTVDYAGAIGMLTLYLGVPPSVGAGRISYGTGQFISEVASDIGVYLSQAVSSEAGAASIFSVDWLSNNLAAMVANWGDPYGLLELELEGSIATLVDLQSQIKGATDPAERSRMGLQLGEVSRRALLLGDAMEPLRAAMSAGESVPAAGDKSALEEQLIKVSGQVKAISETAREEPATIKALEEQPSEGLPTERPELLGVQQVEVPRPISMAGQASIYPEQSLPVTTDKVGIRFLNDLAARASEKAEEVEGLKESVIPKEPRFSLAEFTAVYKRWAAFFSARARDNDPAYKQVDDLYKQLFSMFGYGAMQGGHAGLQIGAGRFLLMQSLEHRARSVLGGADETDFAAQLGRQGATRRGRVSGSASDPSYDYAELFPGAPQDLNLWGEGRSREAFARRQMGRNSELFAELLKLRREGRPEEIGRQAAAAGLVDPANAGGPYWLIRDPQAQQTWSYLVNYGGDVQLEGPPGHEEKRVPPEVVEYLLARGQQADMFLQPHRPSVFDPRSERQVLIGDEGMRSRGVEGAQATGEARFVEGASDATANRQAEEIKERLKGARKQAGADQAVSAQDRMPRVTRDLILDIQSYLNAYFERAKGMDSKVGAVMMIANEEHQAGQKFMAHFSAENLMKGLATIAGIVGGMAALTRFGGNVGAVLRQALTAGLHQYAKGMNESSFFTIAAWMARVSRVSSFGEARAWAYFAREISDELVAVLEMTMVAQGVALATSGVGAISALKREPTTVGDALRMLEPWMREPGNRARVIEAVDAQIKEMRAKGSGETFTDPELKQLEALRARMEGKPLPEDYGLENVSLRQMMTDKTEVFESILANRARAAGEGKSPVEALEAAARERYRTFTKEQLAQMQDISEELFVRQMTSAARGHITASGERGVGRANIITSLMDPENPVLVGVVKGRVEAMDALLKQHGNWRQLISMLSQGTPEMRAAVDQLRARRAQIETEVEFLYHAHLAGARSNAPVSDVDRSITITDAGKLMMEAEAWVKSQYGAGWSEALRMNFYTDAARLTRYETVVGNLSVKQRGMILEEMTKTSEIYNIAKMIHHTGGNRLRMAEVEAYAKKLNVDMNDPRIREVLPKLAEGEIVQERNRLLAELDKMAARYSREDLDPAERVKLALEISKKQMRANLFTEEAYIGPGAARMTVGKARVVGNEAYQAALSNSLDMVHHQISINGGSIALTMRQYEVYKYINRFASAAEMAGVKHPQLKAWQTMSGSIYETVNRGALEEIAHLRTTEPGAQRFPDITDVQAERLYSSWHRFSLEVLVEMKRIAKENPAAWTPAGM